MILAAAFLVFVLDRLTKVIAVKSLVYGKPAAVIPNVFNLTLIFNTGSAFGMLKGMNFLFIIVSVTAISFILVYAARNKIRDKSVLIALGMVVGGAAGNLFDRIRMGSVIDFLDFRVWPVFNLADSFITLGVAILAWKILITKCIRSS
jgi:signal peptidase II